MTYFEIPYQSPTLDLGPDVVTCNSSTHTLQATDGFVKYRWQDGSEGTIYTAWEPGKYWVDAWDICGFKFSDTVLIALDQAVDLDLGNDRMVCQGETVELAVNGFDEVHWWPAAGLNCDVCPTVEVTPTTSEVYYATGISGNCFSTDSIKITVSEEPEISLEAAVGSCGEPATLTAFAISGGDLEYVWSNGLSGGGTIQVYQHGEYAVTATDGNGCSNTRSTVVEFEQALVVSVLFSEIQCPGGSDGSAELIPLNGTPPSVRVFGGCAAGSIIEKKFCPVHRYFLLIGVVFNLFLLNKWVQTNAAGSICKKNN